MNFLVDAHLPRHLALSLKEYGYDAIHTLDLMAGNRTTDNRINEISEIERRAVITKDADFVNSFLISKRPYKLLLVSTGNISSKKLEGIFLKILLNAVQQLSAYDIKRLWQSLTIGISSSWK